MHKFKRKEMIEFFRISVFQVRSHSDADILETAGKVAATTGSKKAALQKLMSFKMIKLGYPMYKR